MATDKPNAIPTWEEVNYAIRESATFDVMDFVIDGWDYPDINTDCISLLNHVSKNIYDYVYQGNKPFNGLLKITYSPDNLLLPYIEYTFTCHVSFFRLVNGNTNVNKAEVMFILGDNIGNYGGKKYITADVQSGGWAELT